MESLYVCLFSNGQIKVGRSIDTASRIASHAERVSCMGVELSDSFTVECAGPAAPRETRLIQRCTESAARRFQSEWFDGLDFLSVCDWATEAAALDFDVAMQAADSFGVRLREARVSAGLTQTQLAQGLAVGGGDLLKAAISSWETDRCLPNIGQLRLMCVRLSVSADHLVFGVRQINSQSA